MQAIAEQASKFLILWDILATRQRLPFLRSTSIVHEGLPEVDYRDAKLFSDRKNCVGIHLNVWGQSLDVVSSLLLVIVLRGILADRRRSDEDELRIVGFQHLVGDDFLQILSVLVQRNMLKLALLHSIVGTEEDGLQRRSVNNLPPSNSKQSSESTINLMRDVADGGGMIWGKIFRAYLVLYPLNPLGTTSNFRL
jgi:hypothetical protein